MDLSFRSAIPKVKREIGYFVIKCVVFSKVIVLMFVILPTVLCHQVCVKCLLLIRFI